MIPREVFERRRVLVQAERVRDFLDRQLTAGASELALGERRITRQEMVALREQLKAALSEAQHERVKEGAASVAYMPRDRTLANLQSLAANELLLGAPLQPPTDREHARSELRAVVDDAELATYEGITGVREQGRVGLAAPPVTAFSVADKIDDDGLSPKRDSDAMAVEGIDPIGSYKSGDPIWLTIGLAEVAREAEKSLGLRVPFNDAPATMRLGERPRLFLVGDWGSGTPRAKLVKEAIRAKLDEPESQTRDCHIIHLGDTYAAGWWWEQEFHVIRLWPASGDAQATSWALAGNHDYYSGTFGYFVWLLGDPLFAHQQGDGRPTSIFELTNDHWCVLGLDSSYVDHDLPDEEVAWLRSALDRAEGAGQRLVLLSHHQPWSGFGDGPDPPLWKRLKAFWSRIMALFGRRPGLWQKVKPLIEPPRSVEAWFWGHEHRLALYHPTGEIRRPRLLGNGGIPSPITDAAYQTHPGLIEFDYEDPLPQDPEWCRFAFGMVDLDEDGLSESYFDEFGNPITV